MAIRGRTPKPTLIRKLEGVPGKSRPLNQREPEPTGPAECPAHIKGKARAEWERVVRSMPAGLYTSADVPVIAVYCQAWVTYRNALDLVEAEGMMSVGANGQPAAHPAVAVMSKQAEIILRAADRLGMSPSARTRLEVRDKPPASKFDGLLSEPGGKAGDLRVVR